MPPDVQSRETNWTPESGLRSTYPQIPWDEPLTLDVGPWDEPLTLDVGEPKRIASASTVIGDVRPIAYVCRYCVAIHKVTGLGVLKGEAGYGSFAEWEKHWREVHHA